MAHEVLIDYKKIADAQKYYAEQGYSIINAPWFVSRRAMQVTSPPGCRFSTGFLGDLVASGEQSFIQLWMDGELDQGKWQCITPCFRDELVVDNLHLNYFLKLELIDVNPENTDNSVAEVVEVASQYFNRYINTKVINTGIGFDIVSLSGIELGSYGFRRYGDFKWVYGTGVAEPRLSYVEKKEWTGNLF